MDQVQLTDAAFATLVWSIGVCAMAASTRTNAPVVDNDRLAVLLSRLLLDDGTAVAPMVARNLAAVIDGQHPKLRPAPMTRRV